MAAADILGAACIGSLMEKFRGVLIPASDQDPDSGVRISVCLRFCDWIWINVVKNGIVTPMEVLRFLLLDHDPSILLMIQDPDSDPKK